MSIAHAILGILFEGDQHAYHIGSILERRIPTGRYNSGQVHQALERIENEGWAVSRTETEFNRSRRPFSITAAGRDEFLSWLPRPVSSSRPVRDEMLVKVVFLGLHDPAQLAILLEERRREHIRRLTVLQRETQLVHTPGSPEAFGQFARDAARFREEAELRWVEHCLARLRTADEEQHAAAESNAVVRKKDRSGSAK